MRDKHDHQTLELEGVAKKKGRKPTGAALTAAERKQKSREKLDLLVSEAYLGHIEWTKSLCLHALTSKHLEQFKLAAYRSLEQFIV